MRKELISTSVFLHKDKGVKAYAACCIADLLSIYAPDAPYTASELRVSPLPPLHFTCPFVRSPLAFLGAQDIFQFFFRQLVNGLKGPDAPYYDQYVHLLRSLSRAKSVVLVCDLPHADELLVEVFKDFFTLSKLNLPATVEAFMADILTALIDEAHSVLNEVLEILLSQFNAKKIVGFRLLLPFACKGLKNDGSVWWTDSDEPDVPTGRRSVQCRCGKAPAVRLPTFYRYHPPALGGHGRRT